MRKRYGRAWPLASFLLVYLIQQGMLVGLTLPLYVVFSSRRAWQPVMDCLATAGCLAGEKVNYYPKPPQGVSEGVSQGAKFILKPCDHAVYKMMAPAGIVMAAIADNQLFRFMEGNERRLAAGKKPALLLDTGERVVSRQPTSAMSSLCRVVRCMTTLLIGLWLRASRSFPASAACHALALLLGASALQGDVQLSML